MQSLTQTVGELPHRVDHRARDKPRRSAWRGGWLIAVPPPNTSRTCPCCGHVSAANRQTQALFRCVGCGFEGNADVVGAINVLRAGHARLAC
ncbi:transposase, partial [Pseudomonas sp. 21LCFQ010]